MCRAPEATYRPRDGLPQCCAGKHVFGKLPVRFNTHLLIRGLFLAPARCRLALAPDPAHRSDVSAIRCGDRRTTRGGTIDILLQHADRRVCNDRTPDRLRLSATRRSGEHRCLDLPAQPLRISRGERRRHVGAGPICTIRPSMPCAMQRARPRACGVALSPISTNTASCKPFCAKILTASVSTIWPFHARSGPAPQ